MNRALSVLLLLSRLYPTLASSQIALQLPNPRWEDEVWRLQWDQKPSDDILGALAARWDVWSGSKDRLDLRVPAFDRENLEGLVNSAAHLSLLHPNVSQLLQDASVQATDEDDTHAAYHPLEGIEALLRLFAADHPKNAQLIEIGSSAENRTIYGLQIGRSKDKRRVTRKGKKRKGKVGMLVVGGQHAREWISTASTLYMAHELLLRADRPPKKLRRLLETYDFTFVPTLNPDGYAYSWSHDRLWRKNRQVVGEECIGIDLNRNWGYKWSSDTLDNPCSDSYPGKEPFQAVEVQALRDYIEHSKQKIVGLLDLHSFGQLLMFPYAFSCAKTPSRVEDLTEAAYGGVRAAEMTNGLTWEVGAACQVSYSSAGQLLDWAYAKGHIKWSFTANLRDMGVHGFLLPPSQIRSAGEETMAMLLSIAQFVRIKEKL